MQLRLFRHFVPLSVVLLASSDALLITGAFYQLLSASEIGAPIVMRVSSFTVQFSAGLAVAAVTAMVSVGLYGHQSFVDFRLLLSKIAVASILVLMLVYFSAIYWREELGYLPDHESFPLKATLIWLVCVSVTRGTFSVTLGRGLLKRRVLVLGNGAQAARIAKLVETGANEHFVPISFIGTPGEHCSLRSDTVDRSVSDPAAPTDDALTEMEYRLGASEIVVATNDRRGLPVHQLLNCKLAGIKVIDFLDFWERETRTIDIEALKPSWLFYSDGFRCGPLDELLKRAFDIAVSLGLPPLNATAPGRDGVLNQAREPWADLLLPGQGGTSRPGFHDSKVPKHASECRDRRPSPLGLREGSARYPHRSHHSQTPGRRARTDF